MRRKRFKKLVGYAKSNKNRFIKGEYLFRKVLLSYQIKHKRQIVIGHYIVDFYFPGRRLIVEIDGAYHKNRKEYDETRENWLKNRGFIILRFTDEQVAQDGKYCAEQILHEPVTENNKKWSYVRIKELNGIKLAKKKQKTNAYYAKQKVSLCGHGRDSKWCVECRYTKSRYV